MATDIQTIKQRFSIIGSSVLLSREIEKALLIAPTDLTVLITGESGVGKEVFPQIIHQNSARKHGTYNAVNCGAIPEGTVDAELFGHEKGAFTGALTDRKGYFEVADHGTLFLDEVGELPLATQARLLRVLETGEFIRVGQSKSQKTDVRIVAATNVDLLRAIRDGKFREDLYYRLNTVPINLPPLRDRQEDIYLLFRKFASDFAEKYRVPAVSLVPEAQQMLAKYRWPGNVRELKNITERMSIFEKDREISAEELKTYLSAPALEHLPAIIPAQAGTHTETGGNEFLYKILYEMRREINELKQMIYDQPIIREQPHVAPPRKEPPAYALPAEEETFAPIQAVSDVATEDNKTLSLGEAEKALIIKALERHNGRRADAAKDLKISERTLYRKIKEYDLEG